LGITIPWVNGAFTLTSNGLSALPANESRPARAASKQLSARKLAQPNNFSLREQYIASSIIRLDAGVIIFREKTSGTHRGRLYLDCRGYCRSCRPGRLFDCRFSTALVVFILSILWKLEDWLKIK
jgi:hypothetical protein